MAGDMADTGFSIVEAEFPGQKYGADQSILGLMPRQRSPLAEDA